MKKSDIVVSGIGVTSAIGQGKRKFASALLEGKHRFDVMRRPGRQYTPAKGETDKLLPQPSRFLGAEIADISMPESIPRGLMRTASLSGLAALATLHEAWHDAELEQVPQDRIGMVIGGSNIQQREIVQLHDRHRERKQYLRPTYAIAFMDSDICGLCTEAFGIRGFAHTVGGASASGQVAVLEAAHAVATGRVDVGIAIGALMDLSYWECQGFRSLGAMGSDRYADAPSLACRPFDQDRDGFIFGESCAVVVVEKEDSAQRMKRKPYARLAGWAMEMDANRNPNPSIEGEMAAIKMALDRAGLSPNEIDYVNPHGTGSAIGDATELESLRRSGLDHAYINATKSIIGHGLSAAGAVEMVAVLLQMEEGRLHPTRNLVNPIESSFRWIKDRIFPHRIENALNLSMGFGGVNTAICMQRYL
jgi:malonyl-ACP decarboxylase